MRCFREFPGRTRSLMTAGAALLAGIVVAGGSPAGAAEIVNTGSGQHFTALDEALAAAKPGDALEIAPGTYTGNFTVDRPLTLRAGPGGGDRPVLDAGGEGTVLTIVAPGVTVEGLSLRNSGKVSTPWTIWGDAAVFVDADGAILRNLVISGNDWGIVVSRGAGTRTEPPSTVENRHDGIKILGGHDHEVVGNRLERNGTGIVVDAYYGEGRESPIPAIGDPAALQRLATRKQTAVGAHDLRIAENTVRGNGTYGIVITWESTRIAVENNEVFNTGRERALDPEMITALEKDLYAGSGIAASLMREHYGSGIALFCLATDNRILANDSHDNLAFGIVLNLVNRNLVSQNEVAANRMGIVLVTANDNRIEKNHVVGNADFGIRIAVAMAVAQPSNGNVLTRNDMEANGVNAFDSSGRALTADDLAGVLDTLPLPDMVRQQMRSDKRMRDKMAASYMKALKTGANAWDDGTLGNRYADFDEVPEGLLDTDGNGIGEAAHPIPGGPSIDRHPLDAARVATARKGD